MIIVTKSDVLTAFEWRYNRSPTQSEYKDLIDFIMSRDTSMLDWLKDEVLAWEDA